MALGGLTIDEYGRALGGVVWLERRCFEVLGERATIEDDPAAKLRLAVASAHHGFHAALLEPLLPDTRDHDPEGFVLPVADAEGLADLDALLGRLDEVIAAATAALTPVTDAAAMRLLRLVRTEHDSDANGVHPVR